tara:strand:- start:691 stop:981 length:291 start_codon:yes stop_codon:yes gene_type:complete
MQKKQNYKKIKLDPPVVKHSVASEHDPKVWHLEELEGEILEFAKYIKSHYGIKFNDTAMAHLHRIGKSTGNLRITSALAMGNLEDLHKYDKKYDNY